MTVGGSATTDGGAGALEALEEAGTTVEHGRAVRRAHARSRRRRSVFGPQKGADPALVSRLEQRLDELAETLPTATRAASR